MGIIVGGKYKQKNLIHHKIQLLGRQHQRLKKLRKHVAGRQESRPKSVDNQSFKVTQTKKRKLFN